MRECPGYSAEQWQAVLQQRQPSQQPAPAPAQQPPDVRPVKDRSGKQDKTCFWVKYRQHKISTLIDTGSDVSIAGEDVARKMGWIIRKHRIKEVCVANNEIMSVRGAAYVTLAVAGRGIESEILIAPDLDGLILGIDWLRHQGRVRWDFEHGRIRFGDKEWTKLRRETEQPGRTSVYKLDQNRSPNKRRGRTFDKQVVDQLDHTGSLAETDTFDLNTEPFTARAEAHSCRFSKKSLDGDKADNLKTMMVETTDATRMSSLSLRYTKKF